MIMNQVMVEDAGIRNNHFVVLYHSLLLIKNKQKSKKLSFQCQVIVIFYIINKHII